ncbi:hypothetical protein [Cystobacter fuscus]|uniref:hypothetical protein n=1 Tax=Cystobacter fuscus TaxID=43 RepID=UPI0037C08C63
MTVVSLVGLGGSLAGSVLLVAGRTLRTRLRRMPRTLVREARAGTFVKMVGQVVAREPVHAPLADVDCAYFQMTVQEVQEEMKKLVQTVYSEKEYATGCGLDDESGRIELEPEGAVFHYLRAREFSVLGGGRLGGLSTEARNQHLCGLIEERGQPAGPAASTQSREGRLGPATDRSIALAICEDLEHALGVSPGLLLLRIEPVRLFTGVESEFLAQAGEARSLGLCFGLESGEHPGFAHRVGTAEDDLEGDEGTCLGVGLSQTLASVLTLVIHVPDEEDRFECRVLKRELASHTKGRACHQGASFPWLTREVSLRHAELVTERIGRQLVEIEITPALPIGHPLAELLGGFGRTVEEIPDPIRTLLA